MNWLVKNFLRGLVIVVPIAVTVWVIYRAFSSLDALLGLRQRGVGVAIIVVGTILIGALASNFIVRRVLRWTEVIFQRAPLVRLVYASVKDLLEAFVGDRKRFDRPVSIALSDTASALGFVTRDDLEFLGIHDRVAVYMPLSYSMTGVMLTVPSSAVTAIVADSTTVLALILSGGISRA